MTTTTIAETVRAAHPGHLVLVEAARGFFECYKSDAATFSRCTNMACSTGRRGVVCGTTSAKLDASLRKLLRAGCRVAIVTLSENGVRQLTRIVTPTA